VWELDQYHVALLVDEANADWQIGLVTLDSQEVLLDQNYLAVTAHVPDRHGTFGLAHARADAFTKDFCHGVLSP
jgi:hypothetical protein